MAAAMRGLGRMDVAVAASAVRGRRPPSRPAAADPEGCVTWPNRQVNMKVGSGLTRMIHEGLLRKPANRPGEVHEARG